MILSQGRHRSVSSTSHQPLPLCSTPHTHTLTLSLTHTWQVSVATNFDAPIKLLFPRALDAVGKRPFAMLGLGDIVSLNAL